MSEQPQRGIDRRKFAKSAVAIGGSAALSVCLHREGSPDLLTGSDNLSTLPERQHAWWNNVLSKDDSKNPVLPRRLRALPFADHSGQEVKNGSA